MVIVVVDADDLEAVAQGENLVNILRRKYEQVRLDLAPYGDKGTYTC